MQFKTDFILIDQTFANKNEMFKQIASIAKKYNLINSEEALVQGFEKREAEGTTGFEDGFAIPHARIDEVKEPAIFVVRNTSKIGDWDSLDGNGVSFAIALLVPATQGSTHMEILSQIAMRMMDETFRNIIKQGNVNDIFNEINTLAIGSSNNAEQEVNNNVETLKSTKKLVGISACPAGVAHTFMAKQKMENSGKEKGYEVKWETQGSQGQKNPLSQEEIDNADIIIIASDIDLDLKRFEGKKLILTDTNDAIKNGVKLIERAETQSVVYSSETKKENSLFMSLFKKSFMSSFGVPWTFMGITVTLLAIISLIGFSMYGRDWANPNINYSLNVNLFKVQEIAKFAVSLAMPFMAMYIVHNMYKKNMLSFVVFVATLLVNSPNLFGAMNTITNGADWNSNVPQINVMFDWNTFNLQKLHGTNIIGGIVTTFGILLVFRITESVANFFKQNRVLKYLNSSLVSNIMFAGGSLIIFVFLLGAPMSWVSGKILYGIVDYAATHWWVRFLVGGILGAMIVVDMGGPINKVSLILIIGLAQHDLRFATLISIGIPCASIGFGTVYFFRKKSFKTADVEESSKSFRKGLKGMTEGPLIASHKYGWRVLLPNFVSTFLAAGLANVMGIYIIAGGHINVLFAGAQAHLATPNDITFLNELFPIWQHQASWWLFIPSILYGIIGYYFVMAVGCFSYLGIASITFALPGKNKVFADKAKA